MLKHVKYTCIIFHKKELNLFNWHFNFYNVSANYIIFLNSCFTVFINDRKLGHEEMRHCLSTHTHTRTHIRSSEWILQQQQQSALTHTNTRWLLRMSLCVYNEKYAYVCLSCQVSGVFKITLQEKHYFSDLIEFENERFRIDKKSERIVSYIIIVLNKFWNVIFMRNI